VALSLAELRKAVSPLRSATALQIGDLAKRRAQTVGRQNLECGGRGERALHRTEERGSGTGARAGDTAFLQGQGANGKRERRRER
jgi:hypothetical protein